MPERIAEEGWGSEHGHCERYRWAANQIGPSDLVLDIACGIGYGADLLKRTECRYVGVDKPGVPSPTFADLGMFIETDIDTWEPKFSFDVGISFETLEHVAYPGHLADILSRARRLVLVSVPTVPTVGINEFHLHDFTEESLPDLFPTMTLREVIPQPSESAHLFAFEP